MLSYMAIRLVLLMQAIIAAYPMVQALLQTMVSGYAVFGLVLAYTGYALRCDRACSLSTGYAYSVSYL